MKITHILTGKNDNYAGFFDDRLILTMKYNFHLYKKFGIDAQFLFVEWSPDNEKPLLSTKLSEVFKGEDFHSYVVGTEIHNHLVEYRQWMTFLEFFAKNVGIRRAKHDYILCSNADIFLTPGVIQSLLQTANNETIYRAERHDIDLENVHKLTEDEFSSAVIKKHSFPKHDKLFIDGSGDFTLAHKDVWNKVNGYDENQRFVKIHKDSRFLFSAALENIKFENLGVIYHVDHGTSVPMTGLGDNYRLANGPYRWKYMDKLPYVNAPHWGLWGDNITEKSIHNNVTQLVVQDYEKLKYPNDQVYYIDDDNNRYKYPEMSYRAESPEHIITTSLSHEWNNNKEGENNE